MDREFSRRKLEHGQWTIESSQNPMVIGLGTKFNGYNVAKFQNVTNARWLTITE
jgi:hypothetical protein